MRRCIAFFSGASVFAMASTALALNQSTHQDMVDHAYQIMRMVEERNRNSTLMSLGSLDSPPEGVSAAQWSQFLTEISDLRVRLPHMPSSLPEPPMASCVPAGRTMTGKLGQVGYPISLGYAVGGDAGCFFRPNLESGELASVLPRSDVDFTGFTLGFWAQNVDNQYSDTHIGFKLTNILGLGAAREAVNEASLFVLGAIFLPIVCFVSFFTGNDDCVGDAHKLADDANLPGKLDQLVTDLAPVWGSWPASDSDDQTLVGMWHHINVQSHPLISNFYDDRQGLLFSEGGPGAVPSAMELVAMGFSDIAGITLNYDTSTGPKRYQITSSSDGHRASVPRDKADWQSTTIPHLAFSPVDNLAQFGWREFKASADHSSHFLGWALHAFGDAVAPHHVVATFGYGHRPFEDAVEREYREIRFRHTAFQYEDDFAQVQRVLADAFSWRNFVKQWRASRPASDANDCPVRDMVTALAQETLQEISDQGNWPFRDELSVLYVAGSGGKQESINAYRDDTALERRLVERGTAAKLAFLMCVGDQLPAPPANCAQVCLQGSDCQTGVCDNGCCTRIIIPT